MVRHDAEYAVEDDLSSSGTDPRNHRVRAQVSIRSDTTLVHEQKWGLMSMNQSLPVLVIFPLTKLCILFGMRQWPMKRRRHMARPRLARLLVRALLMPACSLAYSSGGGRERGVQSCDAIDICKYGCPPGMTKVAPPERSDALRGDDLPQRVRRGATGVARRIELQARLQQVERVGDEGGHATG